MKKKILLAIDALYPDEAALDFACSVARECSGVITGVFLENLVSDERPVLKKTFDLPYLDWEVDTQSAEFRMKRSKFDEHVAHFRHSCKTRDIPYVVHRDRGVPARDLLEESRFADLMIMDAGLSFKREAETEPSSLVRELLKQAECPVLIAPEVNTGIRELVFAYDGSSSSMFAIRQFAYLFPELADRPVVVVQVNDKGNFPGENKYHFREWLRHHFERVRFEEGEGKAETVLTTFLRTRKESLVVMGAFGRNALSLFFRQSHAEELIRTLDQPIFISHI